MVLRRRFCGGGYFRVANATGDAWEETVRNRGVLSQQFSGLGSGGEGQKAASREESSAEREIVGNRAAQSENFAECLSSFSYFPSLRSFISEFYMNAEFELCRRK